MSKEEALRRIKAAEKSGAKTLDLSTHNKFRDRTVKG